MVAKVVRIRGEQAQVLRRVVLTITVVVVDYFLRAQVAAKYPFHHQSMLSHVPAAAVGMFWKPDEDVSILVQLAAASA